MPRLVVNPDSPDAWEIDLHPGINSLGRGEENDVQLEHPSVSHSHCHIVVSGPSVKLKDLGSTSGTFFEGQLVEEVTLRPGQVFNLGDVRLRLETESPAEPSPTGTSRLKRTPLGGGVRLEYRARSAPRFGSGFCGAFLYPLRKDGVLLLIAGTIFLSIINALKFFARYAAVKGIGLGSVISLAFFLLLTALGVGYVNSYLRRVVTSTAMGEQASPDWPDLSDFVADIVSPLFQLGATVLVSLLPAIIAGILVPGPEAVRETAVWVACGLGAIYFPMAFLAVAMFDTVAAVNPLLVAPSIAKIPGHYMLTVVLFGTVLAVMGAGDYYLPKTIAVPIVPSVISTVVGLYLLIVQARVVGLLYLANKERLGWFGRR
jgi:hypothetical protein